MKRQIQSMDNACAARLPTVSIIIPAKNEERTIGKTLQSVRKLDYPMELIEIIIVDNGSVDATGEIVRQEDVTLIEHPTGPVGAVRNRGSQSAKGTILVFIDADVVVQRGFVKAAVEQLKDENVGAVGGIYTASKEGTWVEKAWVVERTREHYETDSLPGGSFVTRRDIFEKDGGFSETLVAGEDDEYARRIAMAGYKVFSIRACDVIHLGYPSTLSGVLRRQVWHGSSQLESAANYKDPVFVLTRIYSISLVSVPLVMYLSNSVYLLMANLLVPASICVAAAATKEAKTSRPKITRFFQRVVLFIAFFLGRSMGLTKNYWVRLKQFIKNRA